jgi:hypothetical protein
VPTEDTHHGSIPFPGVVPLPISEEAFQSAENERKTRLFWLDGQALRSGCNACGCLLESAPLALPGRLYVWLRGVTNQLDRIAESLKELWRGVA